MFQRVFATLVLATFLGNLLIPSRGAPTAGNRGTAVLSSHLAAGRGIR